MRMGGGGSGGGSTIDAHTSIAKHLRSGRSGSKAAEIAHGHHVLVERVGAVLVLGTEAAALHLFESQCQHTIGSATLHKLLGNQQSSAAGAAVVVDVVHRNAGEAQAIDGALATCRITYCWPTTKDGP
jgi:hypothetical protein